MMDECKTNLLIEEAKEMYELLSEIKVGISVEGFKQWAIDLGDKKYTMTRIEEEEYKTDIRSSISDNMIFSSLSYNIDGREVVEILMYNHEGKVISNVCICGEDEKRLELE